MRHLELNSGWSTRAERSRSGPRPGGWSREYSAGWARKSLRLFAMLLFASVTAVAFGNSAHEALPDTVARIKPSIVGIGTVLVTRRPPVALAATGFVVADGRHAVTNAHSIPDRSKLRKSEYLAVLTGPHSRHARRAKVLKIDNVHDLALLRFEGKALKAMKLDDSKRVREGQLYAFTGFPIGIVLGFFPVTHRGIVSAITPIAIPQISSKSLSTAVVRRLKNPYKVFQLDATAYPGNSGSPLYDLRSGRVVGVINKVLVKQTKENVLSAPSGITYAIPSQYVVALMRSSGLK